MVKEVDEEEEKISLQLHCVQEERGKGGWKKEAETGQVCKSRVQSEEK